MRRITKLSAVALSLLLTVPAFAVFDLFGGAEATASAPELFDIPTDHGVRFVQFADATTNTPIIAYVTSDGQGTDVLKIQIRNETGPVLYDRTFDASTTLRNVSAIDLSRDGGHLVVGFTSGHLLYITTTDPQEPFGTERTFRTRSPVTDIALDQSGKWFSAVTYHGDTFLFEHGRFLQAGQPYFHHNPIFLFEQFQPDKEDCVVFCAVRDTILGPGDYPGSKLIEVPLSDHDPTLEDITVELPLTVRPYTHVEISGRASGTAGTGLAVVAGDAYGGVHVFNAKDFEGLVGTAVQEPVSRSLVERVCPEEFIAGDTVRIPCTVDDLADLVDGVNRDTGGTGHLILAEVSNKIRSLAVLDLLTGELQGEIEPPLRGIEATEGLGIGNKHVWTVLVEEDSGVTTTTRVHGFRGQFTPGATSSQVVNDLWVLRDVGHIVDMDLSEPHSESDTGKRATFVIGTGQGDVYTYRVGGGGIVPDLHYEVKDGTGSKTGVAQVAVTTGSESGEDAGKYVAVTAADGQIHLFETTRRDPAPQGGIDTPYVHYRGSTSLSGAFTDLDMTDTGGALTGHADGTAGLEVFASLITVRIEPEHATLDKFQTWTATAIETSPDTEVVDFNWTITRVNDDLFVPIHLSNQTVSYTFNEEGRYNITVMATDDYGLSATAKATLSVATKPPVIAMQHPETALINEVVSVTFNGTHDQDPAPDADYEGIESLTLTSSADSQTIEADLSIPGGSMDDIIIDLTFTDPGVYTITAKATDADGETASTSGQIVIERCPVTGGTSCGPDPEPNNTTAPFTNVGMAWDTGHILFYGSDDPQFSGLYELRTPDLQTIHISNTTHDPVLGTNIASAKLLHDADGFIAGLGDGRGMFVQLDDPANRTLLRPLTTTAIKFTDVSWDGDTALFVSEKGEIRVTSPDLTTVYGSYDVNATTRFVFADRAMDRIVLVDSTGTVRLFDGDNVSRGPDHSFRLEATITAADMPESVADDGDTFVFLGRDDGRVTTLRIIQDRIFGAGTQDLAGADEPIRSLRTSDIMPLTHYKYVATTASDIYLVDSRNLDSNEVADVSKQASLASAPRTLVITDDARRAIVGFSGVDSVHVYDRLWHLGPIDTFDDLDRDHVQGQDTPIDAAIDGSGASITLLKNGNFLWTFSPPEAIARIGPWDKHGDPQFGAPVHVQRNVTFDSTLSFAGDGLPAGYIWKLGDGTQSTAANPVHEFQSIDDCKWHNVDNTIDCRMSFTYVTEVTTPVHTVLRDRDEATFRLWNPPPLAILSVSPFNSSSQQVEVLSGEKIVFDGRASHDTHPGGSIWQHQFRFGDGTGVAKEHGWAEHSYKSPGVYKANLTVYDNDRFADTTEDVTIVVENRAPEALWTYAQPGRNETGGWVTAGVPVDFDGRPSKDPDGSIAAYNWTFVDGSTTAYSTAREPTFTFMSLGLASVTLKVKDDSGEWSAPMTANVPVDDGIRLRQIHKDPDRKYLDPTAKIWVDGHVHDFVGFPALGQDVANATIHAKVYFDGPYNTSKAEDPYATATLVTAADGKARWYIPQNDAGAAYVPGRYRVEMVAEVIDSLDPTTGAYTDTEYSMVTESVFFVEGSV